MSFVVYRSKRANKFNRLRQNIIDPAVIDRYLKSTNKNHDYVKEYNKAFILRKMPQFKFYTKPRLHQMQCFYLTTYYRALLLFLGMGAGKTKLVLDTIRFRKQHHKLKGTLVLTLNIISAQTWADEARKHAPDLKVVVLQGTRDEKLALLAQPADVYVSNYHALLVLLCVRKQVGKTKHKNSYEWIFRASKLSKLLARIDALVVDEVHMLSNTKALLWRLAMRVSRKVRFRYALSGTPFGNSPLPLFAEFQLIDHGETFGTEVTIFKNAFYLQKRGRFTTEWEFDERMKPDLHRMMRNRSISYTKEEVSDLPPLTKQIIWVQQTKEMQEYYKAVTKAASKAMGMEALEFAFVNMRQCTSGYQTLREKVNDDEQRSVLREYVNFPNNPKLEALEGLLQSLPSEEKVLIFVEYVHSIKLVSALLTRMEIQHQTLYGATKDKPAAMHRFYEDPKCQVLLGNNVTISTGINPQEVCRYAIYFETSVRPVIRQQGESRLHRSGQKLPVFIYDLVVTNSVDQQIIEALESGRDLLQDLLTSGNPNILAR